MFEVVLEDEAGELDGWHGEAHDEGHAVELAKNYFPSLNVVGVREMALC